MNFSFNTMHSLKRLTKKTLLILMMLLNHKQPGDTLLNMDFYMKLAKKIGLKKFQAGSNFLFSPLSIHAVLSMVAAGASGRTLKQILSLLKSESTHDLNSAASQLLRLISSEGTLEKEKPLLAMVNGIWVDKSFSLTPSFKETMNTIFRAEAKEVDFQTKVTYVNFTNKLPSLIWKFWLITFIASHGGIQSFLDENMKLY